MKRVLWWAMVCALFAALGAGSALILMPPRFPAGTVIAGVPVGLLTREEAREAIRRHWEPKLLRPVLFRSKVMPRPIEAVPYELGVRLDADATVEEAVRRVAMYRLPRARPGKTIPVYECLRWSVDAKLFSAFAEQMARFDRPRGRPRIRYHQGTVSVRYGQEGRAFDAQATLERLQRAIMAGFAEAELVFTAPPPDERERAIASIRYVLGEKTTFFRAREVSRSHNIRLAAEALDGVILLPGERFSYNETVGRRSASRGFRVAPIFVNGRRVPGVGGGVCQVSSTLYNAALLAGSKIVERHNHQLVVGYIPVGLDASVDFGNKDLKFENNTGGPIAIVAEYHPGRLTVRILGSKAPGNRTFKLVVTDRQATSFPVKTIVDPTLAPGEEKVVQKGGRGFRCSTWRYVYENGRLVKKEFLGRSRYVASTRVVVVGPVPVAPPSPPELVTPTVNTTTGEPEMETANLPETES